MSGKFNHYPSINGAEIELTVHIDAMLTPSAIHTTWMSTRIRCNLVFDAVLLQGSLLA